LRRTRSRRSGKLWGKPFKDKSVTQARESCLSAKKASGKTGFVEYLASAYAAWRISKYAAELAENPNRPVRVPGETGPAQCARLRTDQRYIIVAL